MLLTASIARRPLFMSAIITILLNTLALPSWSQRIPRVEWGFQNDNDLYLLNRQDQYYTNGLLLSVHRAVDSLRLSQHEANRVWGIYGGQQIYTAYTGQISEIEEVDRPITAYLFLGADLSRYYTDE